MQLVWYVVALGTFFALSNLKERRANVSYQLSSKDGEIYRVNDSDDDTDAAADVLATVRQNLRRLVAGLEVGDAGELTREQQQRVGETLRRRFERIRFSENPFRSPSSSSTSFTVNKGDEVVLCLRDVASRDIHDLNTIMYVAIHELAHVACPEVGHTALFLRTFTYLLREAVRLGVYRDEDYIKKPARYCGIVISERVI